LKDRYVKIKFVHCREVEVILKSRDEYRYIGRSISSIRVCANNDNAVAGYSPRCNDFVDRILPSDKLFVSISDKRLSQLHWLLRPLNSCRQTFQYTVSGQTLILACTVLKRIWPLDDGCVDEFMYETGPKCRSPG